MYFDIFRKTTSSPQKYWWVAKGNNHEPMAHSEMLSSKQACINAIRTIKAEASRAPIYDETGDKTGSAADRRVE